jgi:hypothetical protein
MALLSADAGETVTPSDPVGHEVSVSHGFLGRTVLAGAVAREKYLFVRF